jgi:putative transposase
MKKFKSPGHLQRFLSIHDPIANLFHLPRHELPFTDFREERLLAMQIWHKIAQVEAV